jgi:hypothetical protein
MTLIISWEYAVYIQIVFIKNNIERILVIDSTFYLIILVHHQGSPQTKI